MVDVSYYSVPMITENSAPNRYASKILKSIKPKIIENIKFTDFDLYDIDLIPDNSHDHPNHSFLLITLSAPCDAYLSGRHYPATHDSPEEWPTVENLREEYEFEDIINHILWTIDTKDYFGAAFADHEHDDYNFPTEDDIYNHAAEKADAMHEAMIQDQIDAFLEERYS